MVDRKHERGLGQLFVVGFPGPEPPRPFLQFVAEEQIGGVILFEENCPSHQITSQNIERLRAQSRTHQLMVAIDQEGGRVSRLRGAPAEIRSAEAYANESGLEHFREDYSRSAVYMESLGINFDLQPNDVAARGNFCTVDQSGAITDRRAGRIPTSKCIELVNKLRLIKIPGVEVFVEPVQDYRFCLILRGDGLRGEIEDTDPQRKAPPLPAHPRIPEAQHTADLFNQWIAQAREILKNERPANAVTLRGFAIDPNLPKFPEVYQLKAACVAVYPMYKGVSKLVGMDVIHFDGGKPEDEFNAVAKVWDDYDFFFTHIKYTDSRGEDGDFEAKAKVIEGVDAALPILLNLKPDVLIVTGDHSTPAGLKSHSWHPVPTLLWSPGTTRRDECRSFGETEALKGALGHFPATDLMPMALAHARRLQKFGA